MGMHQDALTADSPVNTVRNVALSFFTVVFDADDPQRVARFWATALGREISESGPEWAVLSGEPRIDFMKVPEGKTVKNRVHLDWYAPDRDNEVERLIGLGATRLWDVKNEDFEWTTPRGHRGERVLRRAVRSQCGRVTPVTRRERT
jgi:Glyoxalase-like domain